MASKGMYRLVKIDANNNVVDHTACNQTKCFEGEWLRHDCCDKPQNECICEHVLKPEWKLVWIPSGTEIQHMLTNFGACLKFKPRDEYSTDLKPNAHGYAYNPSDYNDIKSKLEKHCNRNRLVYQVADLQTQKDSLIKLGLTKDASLLDEKIQQLLIEVNAIIV